MMPVGTPVEFDSSILYDAISEAIRNGSDLTVLDERLGAVPPSPLQHRAVRIDSGQIGSTGLRARPGGELGLVETMALTLFHGYDPGAHRASYVLASRDFRSLLRTVLTRTEISGPSSPVFIGRSIKRAGHQLEQLMTFQFKYEILLPEAAGPGV